MNNDIRANGPTALGAPLYRRIAADLWARIQSGSLEAGSRLPSETELATEFGVARLTLRQAIVELQKLGAIEVRRGVGTFVVLPPDLVEVVASVPLARQLSDVTADAVDDIAAPQRSARPVRPVDERVLSDGTDDGPLAHAASGYLGVEVAELRRLDTVMTREDRAWIVNTYWYSRRWARLPELVAEHRLVVPAFLGGFGLDLRYLWRAFSATGANFDEAEALHVPTGSALLVRDGVSGDDAGNPVFYVRRRMRGDEAKFVLRYDQAG